MLNARDSRIFLISTSFGVRLGYLFMPKMFSDSMNLMSNSSNLTSNYPPSVYKVAESDVGFHEFDFGLPPSDIVAQEFDVRFHESDLIFHEFDVKFLYFDLEFVEFTFAL